MSDRRLRARAGRWAGSIALFLQVQAGTSVALVLLQSVLAGHLLTGQPTALDLHGVVGTEVFLTLVGLQLLAALAWAIAGGPFASVVLTAALFGLVTAQSSLGFDGRLALHVPNAFLILLAHLWLYRRTRHSRRLERTTEAQA